MIPDRGVKVHKKLGLALSGGGFRASLFHLGVLRRLAELDLLRHLGVISTVSGGSIIGVHYFLHLKHALEQSSGRPLTRDDYITIIAKVEDEFRRGVAHDLRARLLRNPMANLRMFCTDYSLGKRMARLYTALLYGDVIRTTFPCRSFRRSGVPLSSMKFMLPDKGVAADLEGYNARAVDKVPKLLINATCLNTGRPFRFTLVEVGDSQLGFIRIDEVHVVLSYKQLMSISSKRLPPSPRKAVKIILEEETAKAGEREADSGRTVEAPPVASPYGKYTAVHFIWWLAVQQAVARLLAQPAETKAVLEAFRTATAWDYMEESEVRSPVADFLRDDWDASRRFVQAEFGILRRAKISAWYLQDQEGWVNLDRRDGYTWEEHEERLWNAIEDVDTFMAERLQAAFGPKGGDRKVFWEFVLDLYYLRAAQVFAWTAEESLERLTISDAVAASANFPPVFAPYKLFGLYDRKRVGMLSLTDGGVWDNQGIEALLEEGCTHIIGSDAGGLLGEERSAAGRAGMMSRIVTVMMSNVRGLQLEALREQVRVTKGMQSMTSESCHTPDLDELSSRYDLQAVAFFHMVSNPNDGEPGPQEFPALEPHPQAEAIAKLRTDLDAFSEIEADALIYQGYQLADRFVRKFVYSSFSGLSASRPRNPVALVHTPRVVRVLKAGSKRFLRVVALYPVLSWGLIGLVGAGLFLSFAQVKLSLLELARVLSHSLTVVFRSPWMPYSALVPPAADGSTTITILLLVLLVGAYVGWPRWEDRLSRLLGSYFLKVGANFRVREFVIGVGLTIPLTFFLTARNLQPPEGVSKTDLGWLLVLGIISIVAAVLLYPLLVRSMRQLIDSSPRITSVKAQALGVRVAGLLGLWRKNILWLFWYLPLLLSVLGAVVTNFVLFVARPLFLARGRNRRL